MDVCARVTAAGFAPAALVPIQDLADKEGEPGSWISLGPQPQFLLPCRLPAGWIRVRLKMTSSVRGRVEIFADSGNGFQPSECLDRVECCGVVVRDFFLRLPRPVRAVRLDPLDREGEFQLETFRIDPIPRYAAALHAVAAKLRQLCTPRRIAWAAAKGLGLLFAGQLSRFSYKLMQSLRPTAFSDPGNYHGNADYERWWNQRQLTEKVRQALRDEAAGLRNGPLLSVIVPVYNVAEPYLRAALDSVLRQGYPRWELCIADDGSTAAHVRPVLEEYARRDGRIKVCFLPRNTGISAASNAALEMATGEYIAFLDHDDELAEAALLRCAQALVASPDLDMVYTDEDKLELDGRHVEPFFKPDWSPEYFLSCMYTCHLGVYRAALVREVGGLRSEFDNAQDYDLALRISSRTSHIGHVPEILYHWRKLPTSTATALSAKDQPDAAARNALERHLAETGRAGRVEPGLRPGLHRVRFAIKGKPLVSILIPSACRPLEIRGRHTTLLEQCLDSIRSKSTYSHYEIHLVSSRGITPDLARKLTAWQIDQTSYSAAFNWALAMNLGAARARGEHLLFLNDDVEVITPDWLEAMLEFSQQPEIGAVGAKLFFPDGRLQHVGVTLHGENPRHSFYLSPGDHIGYFGSTMTYRNCSAVTGACLMTHAEVFRSLGGFNTAFAINYNDVDYCLKVQGSGRRVVFTPYAQLYHHESATRPPGATIVELNAFKDHWGEKANRDPYYNLNLSGRFPDYRIEDRRSK